MAHGCPISRAARAKRVRAGSRRSRSRRRGRARASIPILETAPASQLAGVLADGLADRARRDDDRDSHRFVTCFAARRAARARAGNPQRPVQEAIAATGSLLQDVNRNANRNRRKPAAPATRHHDGRSVSENAGFSYGNRRRASYRPSQGSISMSPAARPKRRWGAVRPRANPPLLSLILRLYDVTQGRVLIDGQERARCFRSPACAGRSPSSARR